MFKRNSSTAALLFCMVMVMNLSACATNEKGDKLMFGANVSTYMVQAPIVALDEKINRETQTSNYGDIIFEQSFYPVKTVKTSSDMFQQVKFAGLNAGKLNLSKGTPLYAVVHSKLEGETYCLARAIDEKSNALETILLGGLIGTAEQREQGKRYCLTDTNGDSNFEEVRVMQDNAIYMVQGGVLAAAPISLDTVVPYQRVTNKSEMPKQRIGLELSNGGWVGKPLLFVRALQGEVRQNIKADIIKIGRKEDLPKFVTFNGVTIEVVDYDKETLTYKLISGFKPGTTMGLATYTTYR